MHGGADTGVAAVVSPLLPYPPTAGGVKRTLRLVEAMERAGARPHLLTADPGAPGSADALRERGWTVDVLEEPRPSVRVRLGQHLARRPSPYLTRVGDRLAELAAGRLAFAQFEHVQSAYYAPRAAGVPRALSAHNVDSALLRSMLDHERTLSLGWLRTLNRQKASAAVERRSSRRFDVVLCVSEPDAEHFAARGATAVVVPNGVDDELFDVPAKPEGAEAVLFFGQLDYPPNAHGLERFLVDGWPAVVPARPRARLRVVGAGLGGRLAEAVRRAPQVDAVGLVDEIASELAGCSVVVAPLWQGGGTRIKVLESLAAARPVVGTPLAVEGLAFRSGEHGIAADRPGELAAGVSALLADAGRAEAMGAAGRRHAEGFRWRVVTEPAERLYRTWLGRD